MIPMRRRTNVALGSRVTSTFRCPECRNVCAWVLSSGWACPVHGLVERVVPRPPGWRMRYARNAADGSRWHIVEAGVGDVTVCGEVIEPGWEETGPVPRAHWREVCRLCRSKRRMRTAPPRQMTRRL